MASILNIAQLNPMHVSSQERLDIIALQMKDFDIITLTGTKYKHQPYLNESFSKRKAGTRFCWMLDMEQAGILTITLELASLSTIVPSKRAIWLKKEQYQVTRVAGQPMYVSKQEEAILPSWELTFHPNLQQRKIDQNT